jgi:alpha-2-macroglobulin
LKIGEEGAMRHWLARWAVLLLALGPAAAAIGDSSPQVVMTTSGTGGAGAAIERFTARFSEAMVPLGDPRAPSPFTIACPVAGTDRWIDPQTFVHDFATPLPGGIACTFTIRDKLKSLRGVDVGGQHKFTVDTGGPAARAVLPSRYGDGIEEDQAFLVAANVAPDRASIAANAYCAVDGIGEKIPVDLLPQETVGTVLKGLGTDNYQVSSFLDQAGLPKALPAKQAEFAASTAAIVALKCRRPLPPGHDMALVWSGAIKGPGGRTAGADQRFDYTVRKAFEARFECSRVNAKAGCSPVEPAYVRFTAPIPLAQAQAIRLEMGGKSYAPKFGSDAEHADTKTSATVEEVKFAAPLPEATPGRIILPPDVRDESGRVLANAQRFPLDVRFDAAPPLVKFAAPFGILEAKEGGVLPLSVRAVEPVLQGKALSNVGGRVARIEQGEGEGDARM